MKVFVYWNLHKKCWSIKSLLGPNKGRVVGHADKVLLKHVEPKVSEAGRRRVLRDKQKNVHAGMVGWTKPVHWADRDYIRETKGRNITYNPYKYETFVYADKTDVSFTGSEYALLDASDRSVTVWDY